MHYTPISSVSLRLSDEIITLRAWWCTVLSLPLLKAYYFVYFNLKRCKECETNLSSHQQEVWLTRFPLTACWEYLKRKNERVLEAKNKDPVLLIWSVECSLECVPEEPGCPWTAAWRRSWRLLLHTWTSDRFAEYWTCQHLYLLCLGKLLCLAAWHIELYSTPFVLHGKVQSS